MAYKRLNRALQMLDNKIKEFPVGAISIDDFMPLEDKIKNLRTVLKEMDARILNLRTTIEKSRVPQLSEENINESSEKLIETSSNQIINEKALALCLEAEVIEEMMINRSQQNPEDQEKLTEMVKTLYSINGEGLSLQKKITELIQKKLYLQIEAQTVAQEYQEFLQQQEELRLKKLQESNPDMAQYKQKMEKLVHKINIMKRLIIYFISSTGLLLRHKPILIEMLEKHRDIINFETISNMIENDGSSS